MKKGLYIKLLVFCLLVLVISVMWLYDSIRVKEYKIEVVYVSNLRPYADGESVVDITVQVTRNGVPCPGHDVEIRCGENQGRFIVYLDLTDENGYASFKYTPYDETFKEAGQINFTFLDQSNSLLVGVDKQVEYNELVLISKKGGN